MVYVFAFKTLSLYDKEITQNIFSSIYYAQQSFHESLGACILLECVYAYAFSLQQDQKPVIYLLFNNWKKKKKKKRGGGEKTSAHLKTTQNNQINKKSKPPPINFLYPQYNWGSN